MRMRLSMSSTGSARSGGSLDSSSSGGRALILKIVIAGPSDAANASLQTRLAHAPSGSVTLGTSYCAKYGKEFRLREVFMAGHRIRVRIFRESAAESRTLLPIREEDAPSPLWQDAHAVLFHSNRETDPEHVIANQRLAAIKSRVPYLPRLLLAPTDLKKEEEEALTVLSEGQRVSMHRVSLKDGGGVESAFLAAVGEAFSYWQLRREEELEEDADSGLGLEGNGPRPCFDCRVS